MPGRHRRPSRARIAVITDATGRYSLSYPAVDPSDLTLIIQVFDAKKNVIATSPLQFNPPATLELDIDLGSKPYAGASEFTQLMAVVTRAAGKTAVGVLTQTEANPDITYIVQKTGQPLDRVEKLVMAARYQTYTTVPVDVWYGILRAKLPSNGSQGTGAGSTDFEQRLTDQLDVLMHIPVDQLLQGLQQSIDHNIVDFVLGSALDSIAKTLSAAILGYAQKHPVTGQPSLLVQQTQLAGSQGADPDAVMQLCNLTQNNMDLASAVVKSQKIKTKSDVKKLAALRSSDWETLLKKTPGKVAAADTGTAAAAVEGAKRFARNGY